MSLDNMISRLFESDAPSEGIAKTAENRLLAQLQEEGEADNPYADLSDEDLMKLASEVLGAESEEVAEEGGDTDEELRKLAMDQFNGELMAHAFLHECGLMKEAMLKGQCRVCKTASLEPGQGSRCSACTEG